MKSNLGKFSSAGHTIKGGEHRAERGKGEQLLALGLVHFLQSEVLHPKNKLPRSAPGEECASFLVDGSNCTFFWTSTIFVHFCGN
ncbi:hypothetical protein GDO81_020580 [Engystomops pustulosus]|uniref:Uncharacterized protein n=1 Tax=Engystomops pustulosus TaxID=76066 RepID=A0AAV6YUC7_ENGPU|nr:hypothetical protein GDO81_020580 [Engystomops pustulosus]